MNRKNFLNKTLLYLIPFSHGTWPWKNSRNATFLCSKNLRYGFALGHSILFSLWFLSIEEQQEIRCDNNSFETFWLAAIKLRNADEIYSVYWYWRVEYRSLSNMSSWNFKNSDIEWCLPRSNTNLFALQIRCAVEIEFLILLV